LEVLISACFTGGGLGYKEIFLQTDGAHYTAEKGVLENLTPFVDKDLFDKAKVAYPTGAWTMKDYLEATRRLTVRDKSGRAV